MKRITIKSRLYATAIGIFVILFVIGLVANYYIHNALKHFDAMSLIKDINYSELQLRKLEKDFINLETKNIEFHKNQRSSYQDQFSAIIQEVSNSIDELKKEKIIENNSLTLDLSELNQLFRNYHIAFESLVKISLEKGFKDYGLIGEMRDKIHKVEQMAEMHKNYPEFTISMLMLRRNEKDYLLRKDLKYLEKFKKNIQKLKSQINNSYAPNKNDFTLLLDSYFAIFDNVIQKDMKIGLTQDMGLIYTLNNTSKKIEGTVSGIQKIISQKAREEVNEAIQTLFIVSIILTFIIISILIGVTRRILNSIKRLRNFILRLGQGELPEKLEIKKNDEIADMIKSINSLLDNLNNTREFALAVGQGNLKEEINVFGNKGDLGGSLVEMRQQLLELAEERIENEKKDKIRNWLNEGIAKFSDIMRNDDKNLKEMSYKVLSELITYVNGNQGALFILQNDQEKIYLEKIAAVAYNRDKIAGDKIELGKDIVGRCAFEKRSIYMTNIPDDYIKITSGLGYATPTNIFIVPIKKDKEVLGVIELASFTEFTEHVQDFIERVADNLGSTVATIKTNEQTQNLLSQAQEQADEIASQEEELRQNMEEMQATQEEANRREDSLRKELIAIQNLVPIMEVKPDGSIIDLNKLCEELFNISGASLRNQSIFNLVKNENFKYQLSTLIQSAYAGGTGKAYVSLSVIGSEYNLKLKSNSIKNEDVVEKIVISLQKIREEELKMKTPDTPYQSNIEKQVFN
jgi:methyl-accepting chemotaxis protein